MINIFLNVARAVFREDPQAATDEERWRADPLAHPALAVMSQRELADLPLSARFARSIKEPKGC